MPGLLFDPHTEHFAHHNAPIAENYSSFALADAIAVLALQQKPSGLKFLPSNSDDDGTAFRNSIPETEIFACDNFRMYEFKVRRCMRGRSHDWTECPFAHPGEKARRRDPRRVHYSGSPCPDFRKGSCRRGDFCEFAHGVFECWLHPARYRTQACKDGKNCKRRVCFFAHSPEQLRLLPVSVGGSPAHTVSMGDSPIHTASMAGFSSQAVSLEGSPFQTVSMEDSPSQAVSVEFSPSQTVSTVGLPSQKVSMMGSPEQKVSMASSLSQKTKMMGSSSACMADLPSQKTSMLGPPSLVSPVTLHSCSLSGSPLRQALVHSFLTSEGYGGGGYPSSSATASSAEYFSGSDGSAGVPLGSSNPYLQSSPWGKGSDEVEEASQLGSSKINLQLSSLGRSKYELSSQSYGFPSPTSTLAGHYYFPPPLSPPLSPLSSPNSNQTNGTFAHPAHGLHNLHVDATISNREMNDLIFIHNTDHKEDLGFTTQDLQSPHLLYHAQPSLQKLPFKHGKVDSTRLQLHQGSHSLPHVSHSLPCTTRQSRWSPLCNLWDSNGSGLNILPHEVEGHDLQVKIYNRLGEESPRDNLMPDVGWVSELVK